MTWREWRRMFRFERTVKIPHLSITCMCPYAFVRVAWYYNERKFEAWPSRWATGVVLGWRWPWWKTFREKQWVRYDEMPLALYGAMDQAYTARATKELGWGDEAADNPYACGQYSPYIAATIREIRRRRPCIHPYWIANCLDCGRAALSLAVSLTARVSPEAIPDPREEPIVAFRRREAEAKRLAAGRGALPEVTTDAE
jgi:hypothetical protein